MKPNEQNLERLIKRVAKAQDVDEKQLLFHWDGLGPAGDRILLRVLRRQKGWDAFVNWTVRHPKTQTRLQRLVDRAGATDEIVNALKQAGMQPSSGDTARTVANQIVQSVKEHATEQWGRAHSALMQDRELLATIVEILEEDPSSAGFSFLNSLLELPLNADQDRVIRKSLYQLREKGFEVRRQSESKQDKELFYFGENRIAFWHPIFYFRNTSAFSNLGDLYVMMVQEGKDFEISEQQNSVRIDAERMETLVTDYSRRLQERSGLSIPFQQVPAEVAHYLLQRSAAVLDGSSAESRIQDFLRFIGADRPSPVRLQTEQAEITPAQTAELLSSAFFVNWFLPAGALEEFFASIQASQKGPIILPEARQRELQHTAANEAFSNYFSSLNRNIWSVAFEKASLFLRKSDPSAANDAQAIADALRNEAVPIDAIPAARILFDRTIETLAKQKQAQQEAEKQTSLIMSPEEFARSQQKRK